MFIMIFLNKNLYQIVIFSNLNKAFIEKFQLIKQVFFFPLNIFFTIRVTILIKLFKV